MTDDLSRIQAGEGSKFNSALAELERQHNLLMMANRASAEGNLFLWCRLLNALYREIAPYLSEKELVELRAARVSSVPSDKKAGAAAVGRLDAFEMMIRSYRARKKLALTADENASNAALR